MKLLGSKKFRKIVSKGEIKKLLQDRSTNVGNIIWQPKDDGKIIYNITAIYIDAQMSSIHVLGLFTGESFNASMPVYFSLAGKITIFKTNLISMNEKEAHLSVPEEISDEELRSVSRVTFESYNTFNNATISFPNIFVKYVNPNAKVKVYDINSKGLGVILPKNQCKYFIVNEEINLERLGTIKLHKKIPGKVVYIQLVESYVTDDPDMVYKIGIKLNEEIPKATLDQYLNYVNLNEAARKKSGV